MPEQNTGDLARIHLWVVGHVQGVGFRAFAQHAGLQHGLSGWVRNVGYDRVELVAEGPRLALEQFIGLIRSGPRAGRVDDLRLAWEPPTGEFRNFGVRYDA